MKRKLRILVVFGLFFFLSVKGFSQFSISYYSSSLSKIGLGFNFSDRFWSELRLYSNTDLFDLTPEFVICFNFVKRERHNVYFGVGGNVNYFTGFVMPIGVQFSPFEKFDRFSLHIELQPSLDVIVSGLTIQSAWGLRYRFGKRE